MTVPFLDLALTTKLRRAEMIEAATRVLDSGRFILGNEVADFERSFAAYCVAPIAVGVGNGLEALTLALRAHHIGQGDEVIVPSNTFIATWLAVTHVGASLVPVEPNVETYNIDPARVEAAITSATKAIIPVHLYGQPADLDPLRNLAQRYNLVLIEDAAQAHGARYKGQPIGSGESAIAAWSFYPGKNLGAVGDGGALTCGPEIAAVVKQLRNYGSSLKYEHDIVGYNSRLDEIQAAFLSIKLRYLNEDNSRRQAIAARYKAGLAGRGLILPFVPSWAEPVWHLFVVRHPARDRLAEHLRNAGVATMIHYPIAPHLQSAYGFLEYREGDFPISEAIHREILSLPMSSSLDDESIDRVIDAICCFD